MSELVDFSRFTVYFDQLQALYSDNTIDNRYINIDIQWVHNNKYNK